MPHDVQSAMAASIRGSLGTQVIAPAPVVGLTPHERLAIHARNVRTGLTAALASTFPAVERLTGERFFAYTAAQFIAAEPPRSPVVAAYGGGFCTFLGTFAPTAGLAWLAEVARLEWTMRTLADRLPPPPLDVTTLAGLSDARFAWSPSAVLFHSKFPVDRLADADDRSTVDLTQPAHLLLTAGDSAVCRHRLEPAVLAFLGDLAAGASLTAAIAHALLENPAFDAAAALRFAFTEGCFTTLIPL